MLIYDRAEMTSRERTPEGYLKVRARLSRTGMQDYLRMELGLDGDPYERVRVYRPPEEVFDAESLASFSLKPVTDDHPSENVTAANIRALAIGWAGESITKDGDYTMGTLLITDSDAIAKIDAGKAELSPGYAVDLELKPGTAPDGSAYDAVQRKIRGNHIALVDAGRCGGECRILDRSVNDCGGSCDCASCQRRDKEKHMSDKPEKKDGYVVDGVPVDTLDDAKRVIDSLQQRIAQDKDRMIELRGEVTNAMDSHRKRERELEDQIDSLKKQIGDEAVEKAAEQRIEVMTKAAQYLPANYDTAGKKTAQIARDAVVAVHGAEKLQGRDDNYALAAFDMLEDASVERQPSAAAHVIPSQRDRVPTVDKIHFDYRKRIADAWRRDHNKQAEAH